MFLLLLYFVVLLLLLLFSCCHVATLQLLLLLQLPHSAIVHHQRQHQWAWQLRVYAHFMQLKLLLLLYF